MADWIETALSADVAAAAAAVQVAAVTEAGRQADALLGEPPLPGSVEWHAEEGTDAAVRRQRAWELLQLRIALGAGLDPLPVLVGLRRRGHLGRSAGLPASPGSPPTSAGRRWSRRCSTRWSSSEGAQRLGVETTGDMSS
jgi:hypothetical protein